MLVELSVTNFRSFRDTQTFTMSKGTGSEMETTNTFNAATAKNISLLKSSAIYGPNASGKSNLLQALQAMKRMVVGSAVNMQRGDKIPVTPFLLNTETRQHPSEFEVTFLVDEVRYQYGFSATSQRIHDEWLFAYPKGRPQRWFSRVWVDEEEHYDWELGNHLSGEKQLWQKSTRDNALFLSTAVHLNSEQLQPIFDWFKKTLRLSNVGGWSWEFSASLCESGEKERVLEFLRAADLQIDDILVESKPFDVNDLPKELPQPLIELIAATSNNDSKNIKLRTVRKDEKGNPVIFDFDDESDGTQKLFSFAGPWLDSLTNGYVLFIDELHDNLHPKLVKFLVQLFHNPLTNPKNAQLVFTTHETSILSQDVFRRDQIWFCEKDDKQGTMLYPLSDFSPRKGRENLESAYLSGRYGAMPFIRPVQPLA